MAHLKLKERPKLSGVIRIFDGNGNSTFDMNGNGKFDKNGNGKTDCNGNGQISL